MSAEKNETILQIKNIEKRYDTTNILNDLSLEVKKGEVVVILGPSGCGKSTLLRCINGLEDIQAGEIILNGENIRQSKQKMHTVRQKVGMVFQSYDLFPHMNIIENITLAPVKAQGRKKEEVHKEAEQLLERVGLLDKAYAYPRQLSGGQKQRVAIVRALCMQPEIMLFDEVTAALDPEMVREVLDVVLELAKQGMTMLIVTHEMSFARAIADRIIFLDEGLIVEESEPEAFFTNPSTERARKFLDVFSFEKVHNSETQKIGIS
ncbi:amino acid ABC transporter ATP-binding protein [Anaerosporobacter sp.]|uniref:amino acid ABC transporter ATP-binding protein n=1 Tax=Anaerosporobacter sp. TaxID=1872529 RepID=UPI00286ECC6E|nr:amino acid ABC transporter ATP-binding protein [Anaerosporobacter sp.]